MTKIDQKSRLTFNEKVALVWFLIDSFTHLSIELGYVYLALTSTAAKSDTYLGHIWREYGRADARWAIRDANVISIEIATVLMGVLCVFQVFGVWRRSSWRHALQIVICVAELYGGWMTFAPEWLEGSPNLNGSDFNLLWIYLVFMNGLWVVVPLLLLWDSIARISHVCAEPKNPLPINEGYPPMSPGAVWFKLTAMVIAVYMVLVPAVLFTAPGVPVTKE